ncbi:hypothetical protein NCS57_00780900 [Fusarium keratoplasticum]|uniref:Uncharacterized protein n=1 Tax=Fusarium keratoplasticum TaxID=1328300 RepID=A0ACC0QX88_9HYPO|nr:hypothetical protein NCS57_00780900 [Fusarium keratoplasticum]KAI8669652.1 hypothetical protein NCS57_00780900 [Fusarium keratoplasticum]
MNAYFEKHLSLPKDEAARLQKEYSRQYGQALQGLVRHHQIDPLDYNAQVDDALPLEDLIKPDPLLRQFLENIDTSKVKLWLLTNAYINHATRVVRLLGVDDLFEGLTYCDYGQVPLVCKPHEDMFRKAMKEAGVSEVENCYFIDDSYSNCSGAQKAGWIAIHYLEKGLSEPSEPAGQYCIRNLEQLGDVLPQFFKALN